jgi:MoaA/NifB/PqqE/SkfB family radical SAM enzyme
MYVRMAARLLTRTDLRLLWKLAYNLGFKGLRSIRKHRRRVRRGQFFPPLLYVSIVNGGSLARQSTGVDVGVRLQMLDPAAFEQLIAEAKKLGNRFFGILGGEPLVHPQLLDILAAHRDCYFQIVTSGESITDELARRLRRLGNVTPLVSIAGSEILDAPGTAPSHTNSKSLAGLKHCLDQRLVTGVAVRLDQSNIDQLLTDASVDGLIKLGVLYVCYEVYRPIGPDARPELALTPDQQRRVRQFVVDTRVNKPIGVFDVNYDRRGALICPAATGISHHVSPWGDIEPCPIVQFAKESIHTPGNLRDKFIKSEFLADFRRVAAQSTRGCIALERPDLLRAVVAKHAARDTTPGQSATAELQSAMPCAAVEDPELRIRERSLLYRLLKRFWCSDFGVYAGGHPLARPLKSQPPPKLPSAR